VSVLQGDEQASCWVGQKGDSLSIHLVGEQHIVVRVHGALHRDGGAIEGARSIVVVSLYCYQYRVCLQLLSTKRSCCPQKEASVFLRHCPGELHRNDGGVTCAHPIDVVALQEESHGKLPHCLTIPVVSRCEGSNCRGVE